MSSDAPIPERDMPQGGDYSTEERQLHAMEHQTDQLERIADALETIATVITNESTHRHSEQSEAPDGDSGGEHRTVSIPEGYRHGLQQLMLGYGVDVSETKIVNKPDENKIVVDDRQGLDTGEDSPWREFTNDLFGDEKLGNIEWEKADSGDWYPAEFWIHYGDYDEFVEEAGDDA